MPFSLLSDYHDRLKGLHTPWAASEFPQPELIAINRPLADFLQLDLTGLEADALAQIFAGAHKPEGAVPIAQAYAGHQFGQFNTQMGDGRALLLGEARARDGVLYDVQLKGSGRTPYSRGGDGKSALGPVLREYLVAEAMHAMGVPTTRALAAVSTGEQVLRDNALPGGIVTRTAASHIRIGTFEYFASRIHSEDGARAKLQRLTDYTIMRHYPDLADAESPALALLQAYSERLANLVAHWMGLGFIHGVMNTDNMAISGETIDYGPCAFIDRFSASAVFSSIDRQGRYAYGNQPAIAQWNLARLAEALLMLTVGADEKVTEAHVAPFNEALNQYNKHYERAIETRFGAKLGLERGAPVQIIKSLLAMLEENRVDFTGFFRSLSAYVRGNKAAMQVHFEDIRMFDAWAEDWQAKLAEEAMPANKVATTMDAINPIYIPRNHLLESALTDAVEHGDYTAWRKMLGIVTQPFTHQEGAESYASLAPDEFYPYRTFCGT